MPREDKTEAATPRRRQEARRRGQVARSIEVNTAMVLFAGLVALSAWGTSSFSQLFIFTQGILARSAAMELNESQLGSISWAILVEVARVAGPVILACALAGLLSNIAQLGFLVTLEPLIPRLDRLNPANGLARLFSPRAGMELVKSVAKVAIVGYIGYSTLRQELPRLVMASGMDNGSIIALIRGLSLRLGFRVIPALAVLAAVDYIFQRREFEANLRMTKQEVKEEFRQMEGDPVLRSRIRARQRQIAMHRMMQDVPKADVVVTNPTHLAVALKYDSKTMNAPRVVAKGARLIAERIKAIAREHNIPVVENPPLAQALYKAVDIGKEIPPHLYKAVAEILAYVFYLNKRAAR
ncbi:MAG TPA: flagellar biosynthesis protein FlhB [Firmicutes bacterium]|nr:flagellar biosynthesis protein FlhB [Bacillota bacterium]